MNQIIVFLSLLAFTNLLSVRCQFFFDPSEDVGSSPRSSPQSSSPSFPQFSGFNNVPHLRILAGDPQNPSVTRISRFDFPQDGRPPSDRSNGFSDLSGNFLEGPGPNQFSRPNPLNPFAGFLRPGLGGSQNGPSEFTPSSSFPRFPSSQPSQPFFQPPTNPFRPSQPSNSLNSLNSFNSLQPQPQLQPQSQPRPPQFVAAPPLRPPQFSSTPAQRPPQFVPAPTPPTSGGPLFVTPPPRTQSFPQSRPQSDPGILFVTPPPRSEILPRTTNSDFGANEFRFSGPRPPIPPPSQTGREERPSLLISFQNQNRNIQPTSGVRPFLNPATIRQPPSTSSVSSSARPSLSSGVEYAEDEGGVSNEQPERRPVDTGFRTARVQARPAFEPSFFGFGNSPASPNDLLINLYGLNANRTSPAVPSSFRPPARSFFSEPAPPSSGSGRNTGSPFEFEFPLLNQFARDNNIQIHGHSPNSLRTIRPPPSSNTLVAIPLGTPPDSVAVAFGLQPPPSSAPVNTSSLTALKDVILAQQFARLQANRESRPTIGSDQPVSIGEERATTERPGARVPTYYQPTPPRATQQPPRNNIEYVQPVARSRPTYRQPSVEATTRRPPYPEDAGVPERANVVPVPNTIEGNAGIEHYGLPVGHFPDLARLPKNQSSSVSINRPPVVVTAAPPLPTAAYRPPSPPPAVVQPAIRPLPPSFSYLEPSEATTPRPTSPPYDRRPLTNQPQYGRFRPAPVSRTPYAPEFRRAVAVPAQGEPVTSEPVTQPPATTRRPSFRRPSYEYRPATRRPVATTQAPPANAESGNDVNDLGYGRSLRGPQTPPGTSSSSNVNTNVNSINFVRHDQSNPSADRDSGDTGRPQPVRGFVRPDGRTVPNVGPNVRVVAVRRSRQNATAIQRTGTGPSGRPFRVALRQPATTSLATTASTLPSTTVKPQVAFNASNIPNSGRLPADTDGDGIPGHAGKDYPSLLNIPKTSFSCANMPTNGYYADTEAQCQVVHLCQFGGTQDSFLCPNGTIFNQQRFSCQWWFEVDCASAPKYYGLNDNFHREPNSGNELPVDSVRRGSRRN